MFSFLKKLPNFEKLCAKVQVIRTNVQLSEPGFVLTLVWRQQVKNLLQLLIRPPPQSGSWNLKATNCPKSHIALPHPTSLVNSANPLTFSVCFKQRLDLSSPALSRGGQYIDEKLLKADKSVFLKSLATYRYRKMEVLKLSKNYRYRKIHKILADK